MRLFHCFLHLTFDLYYTYYSPVLAKNMQDLNLRIGVRKKGRGSVTLKQRLNISFIYFPQHNLQMTSAFPSNILTKVTKNGMNATLELKAR